MADKKTIYCVDDNRANLFLLEKALKDYDTVSLESGTACLEEIEKKLPDLILLDVMMPELDGLETCKKIRANPKFRDVPIIFLSAKFTLQDKLQGYAAGGDDYLGKPFNLEELKAKMSATLQRKQQLDESRNEAKQAQDSNQEMISNLGETNVVVNFLQNALNCMNYQALAEKVIQAMQNLGLNIVMEIQYDGKWHQFSTTTTENPFEQSVFEFVRQKGRLVSFGERTAVNYQFISIIIRNMPTQDEAMCGRIRDHITLIGKAANAKISAIHKDALTKEKFSMLIDFLGDLKNILSNLDNAYEEHQTFIEGTLAKVADELEQSFMQLGLSDYQEEEQRKIISRAETQTFEQNDKFSKIHQQFSSMSRQVDTVLEHTINAMLEEEEELQKSDMEENVSLF